MPRSSKGPWEKKGRGWHVQHKNRRVFLSHDKQEAKRLWHRLQSGQSLDDAPAGSVLFWEAADAYCAEIDRTRSKRHLRGTRWRLDQLCEHWSKRAVMSLRNADVEKALAAHDWNATTQANVLTALRGLLRWASRPGGLIPENPLPQLTLPQAETRVHTLTKAQAADLLAAAGQPLVMLLWALMITGARPSELIRAKASDCDADGSAVRLPKGKQGRRIIFFPPYARPIMAAMRAESIGGPLFRQTNGNAWSEYWFFAQARAARKKAELPEWATAYTLRHTFATNLLRQGVPIATVARLLGTSVGMIDRVYGHFADQDLKDVADRL